uniref:Uncharacterized protein n=1 Tax=Anguilla anguilla TaxID=7936 RepID=A0A0E9SRL5_ANGAN
MPSVFFQRINKLKAESLYRLTVSRTLFTQQEHGKNEALTPMALQYL